jgi:hypothetical protein
MMRLTIIGFLLAFSGAAFSAGVGERDLTYSLVLFVHQILFVFWLGPDIGIYMWSTKATNPELTPAQRVSAGRIMRVIDIIPRACMSLMLTVGGVLTELMGIDHPWWQMVGIWLLGPVWLTLTLLVFFGQGSDKGAQLAKLDVLFRWVVIATVLLSVAFSVVTDRLAEAPWVTGKLLIFAAVVFFGLMMKARLAPFVASIDRLEADGPSPELDQTMSASVGGARPFMFAAWIALAMAAGLGIFQPGSPITAQEVIVVEELRG